MANRKSTKLPAGTPVRVNPGVTMPEFPEVDISGWTGTISESQGRGDTIKYIVEWDAATLAGIPPPYAAHCEKNGLYAGMACLSGKDLTALESQ